MNELALTVPVDVLDALVERAAALVLEQVGDRLAGHEDGWLDTRAAAAYAGCTPNALHKATARREVRFEQDVDGGKCWFKRSDIDAWRRGDA